MQKIEFDITLTRTVASQVGIVFMAGGLFEFVFRKDPPVDPVTASWFMVAGIILIVSSLWRHK